MSTLALLGIGAGSIGLLLLLIIRWQVHAFVAMMLVSFLVAFATGMPIGDIISTLIAGMGGTLGSVAILVALDGYAFMHPVLREVRARDYSFWLALDNWQDMMKVVGLLEIPRLVLGVGLQVIALGLILKARIAWAFSLVLLVGTGTFAILGDHGRAANFAAAGTQNHQG